MSKNTKTTPQELLEKVQSGEKQDNPSTMDSGTPPESLGEGQVTQSEGEKLGLDQTSVNDKPDGKPEDKDIKDDEVKTVEPDVKETELPNALELQGKLGISQVVDFDALREQVSPTGKNVLFNIEEYMTKMAPNVPMDVNTGSKFQVRLYRTLEIVFNHLDDNDFNKIYPAILNLFHEHGDEAEKLGVFSSGYVYRFPEYINLATNEREAFNRWLNMIIVTAKVSTRVDAVKSLNWDHVLGIGLSDDARTRLQAFYNV